MNYLIIPEYDCAEWFCILGRTIMCVFCGNEWKIDRKEIIRENEGSQNICVDLSLLFFFEWVVCGWGLA